MEVFGQDMIIGEFCLSDHGLMLGSFNYSGDSEDDLGLEHTTEEVYTDNSAVPLFLGAKYSKKLELEITILKRCTFDPFTEYEIRDVLRSLTGMPFYQWARIETDEPDELLYYYCRTINASLQRINGKVVGIILTLECDSPYAWTQEFTYKYDVKANEPFYFFNQSDDIYSDFYPLVTITVKEPIEVLNIVNNTYNDQTTKITNIVKNEILTIDNENQVLTTSEVGKDLFVNDRFNFCWLGFLPGRNKLTADHDLSLEIKCRFPRKVGIQL